MHCSGRPARLSLCSRGVMCVSALCLPLLLACQQGPSGLLTTDPGTLSEQVLSWAEHRTAPGAAHVPGPGPRSGHPPGLCGPGSLEVSGGDTQMTPKRRGSRRPGYNGEDTGVRALPVSLAILTPAWGHRRSQPRGAQKGHAAPSPGPGTLVAHPGVGDRTWVQLWQSRGGRDGVPGKARSSLSAGGCCRWPLHCCHRDGPVNKQSCRDDLNCARAGWKTQVW